MNKCVFTKKGSERHSGEAKLMVPGFRSHKVPTWLGFISTDGKSIANSVYTGEVTLPDGRYNLVINKMLFRSIQGSIFCKAKGPYDS